jgi:transcriptional regulator with XRE-family HTH domain
MLLFVYSFFKDQVILEPILNNKQQVKYNIMIDEEKIPAKIKQLRLARKLTQKELGNMIGVTTGYISRIENARSAPPVGTLNALSKAFDIDFNSFFENEDEEKIFSVTTKKDRFIIARDKSAKIKYQHLAMNFPNRAFESYIISTPPLDNEFKETSKSTQHNGQELWYILKGTFEIHMDGKTIQLEEEDSIMFDAGYTHSGSCLSKDGGEILSIIWNANDTEPGKKTENKREI